MTKTKVTVTRKHVPPVLTFPAYLSFSVRLRLVLAISEGEFSTYSNEFSQEVPGSTVTFKMVIFSLGIDSPNKTILTSSTSSG